MKPLQNQKGNTDAIAAAVAFVICMFILLSVVTVFGGNDSEPLKEGLVYKEEIYSLKDNSETDGSFVLGTGYVDNKEEYKFMAKEEDGGLVQKSTPVASAKIFYLENKDDQPYMEKHREIADSILPAVSYEYHFYLPKGSVTEEFEVDLE